MKRLTAKMNDDSLIRELRRMAPETGSLHCLGCAYENGCSLRGCAIIKQAVERLEELAEPEPDVPLTVEELREMDGEPVWVSVSKNWKKSGVSEGWCLVGFRTDNDRVRAYIYNARHGASFFTQQEYGISWLAYRRKPQEIALEHKRAAAPAGRAEHFKARFEHRE